MLSSSKKRKHSSFLTALFMMLVMTLLVGFTLLLSSCQLIKKSTDKKEDVSNDESNTEVNRKFVNDETKFINDYSISSSNYGFYVYLKNDSCAMCERANVIIDSYFESNMSDRIFIFDYDVFSEIKSKDVLADIKMQLSNKTNHNFFVSIVTPVVFFVRNQNVEGVTIGLSEDADVAFTTLSKLKFNNSG